ncbi:AbrB/MazE/SpoVT family DNA-binding domain-containing protein [Thermus caldilimi]|uniref:AbrB/MazE/SpoVT family DNA-binding domain-containing protein n=1 Tax=Thermus caldilimi TaxID=2483360 RepID=UPI0010762FB9|nr:AbrB/MazE/SpoVT family DNA-binding domain-containing protein [Thermus caldilimi]
MATVTISPKYQITLPAEVRQALLHPGEKRLVEVVGGEIRLRSWRPPVRQLVRELLQAYPEEAEAVGKATGHDAVGYIRKLRKG